LVRTLAYREIYFGADPEFFFQLKNNGKVLESGIALKEIMEKWKSTFADKNYYPTMYFKSDGVQVEINPQPATCRVVAGGNLGHPIQNLYEVLKKTNYTPDNRVLIELTDEELSKLSTKAKRLGCAPSLHIDNYVKPLNIDGSKYNFRSAGGHIHLGTYNISKDCPIKHDQKLLVDLLDRILGNTCVLIDRDEANIERRKLYGQAGEYRITTQWEGTVHERKGVEYRVLSNFWLASYQLMSMVYGLARMAHNIARKIYWDEHFSQDMRIKKYGTPFRRAFIDKVPRENIIRAINENNFNLAKENFDAIKNNLAKFGGYDTEHCPINLRYLNYFDHFVDKGLSYWFGKFKGYEAWINGTESGQGFESFLKGVVCPDYRLKPKGISRWKYYRYGFIAFDEDGRRIE